MPNLHLATNLISLIDESISKDQGSAYRGFLGQVMPHMGDAYRTGEDKFRSHMGASLIGGDCARKIWYGFRWSVKSSFAGRILRLFNRGHSEEARFIAMLLSIGVQVYQQDANGNQFRISDVGGHFGGSGDGVAFGLPDFAAGTAVLLEFKTHNDKSFKSLAANGVRDAKFEHYVQMQVYMRKMGLAVALYMAVNKNDDTLYGEYIYLEYEVGDKFIDRARKIIPLHKAPDGISRMPSWFECKWCDMAQICHGKKMPEVNCRTCAYSFPDIENGGWHCNKSALGPKPLTKEDQLAACGDYVVNPTFG